MKEADEGKHSQIKEMLLARSLSLPLKPKTHMTGIIVSLPGETLHVGKGCLQICEVMLV